MSARYGPSQAPVRDGTAHDDLPLEGRYLSASGYAQAGNSHEALRLYRDLQQESLPSRLAALVENDLAALALLEGDVHQAERGFEKALQLDAGCTVAIRNLQLVRRSASSATRPIAPIVSTSAAAGEISHHQRQQPTSTSKSTNGRTKVAIVSLLFNWPSTGGGTIHTAETGKFLTRAGYDVKHFYAQHADWGMGRVDEPLEHDAQPVCFDANEWNTDEIRARFRRVVGEFQPDAVIVTDSWNTKVLLAEAVSEHPYFLRLAALECLCPLNNVRMLFDANGISVCPRNQLATPDLCRSCVGQREQFTGALHRAERALAGFEQPDYSERLRRAVANAAAVLVVNPLIAEMVRPFAQRVETVPSGFDPERFPWPWPENPSRNGHRKQIFFAGLVEEAMKGFHILDAACRLLWSRRHDFELVATGDPPGPVNDYTRYVGWLSQAELPSAIRKADILAFPTVAEEALGRSAVEAMGVGRPVVAARIGGLQFTVVDGATGLLFEPGNANDLADKLERLLDDEVLRQMLGETGRRRFEEHYTWDVIIDRHYRPLLAAVAGRRSS